MRSIKEFEYQQLVEATQGFCPSRLVGKGSHGWVYKGILHQHLLAIKTPASSSPDNLYKLHNEIRLLSSLSSQNPHHVVNFLGTSNSNTNTLLVMEFMPNGSLHDLLHVSLHPPPWKQRIAMAMQIARALQFLHQSHPWVIHRDVKSTNILFDSNWNPKLADFGLAVSQADSPNRIQPAGTIGYLDPSYTSPSKLTNKTDVFSFGVVLLEIISGRKAIDVSRAPSSIIDWAMPLIKDDRLAEVCDRRLALPPPCMEAAVRHILHVAARCVSAEGEKRPEMTEIALLDKCSLVERVRFSSWMTLVGNVSFFMLKKKQRRWGKCEKKGGGGGGDVSRGKMILREILAELH